jgi:hypothetical protein
MKSGIMYFSETGDRWDAGFHLLRQEIEPRTLELERTIARDDAIARLDRVPLRFKGALLALGWGSSIRTLSQKTIEPIQAKYPYMCLALLERDSEEAIGVMASEISVLQQSITALHDLVDPDVAAPDEERGHVQAPDEGAMPAGLRAGWIYPLADPDRYWDEDDADTYGIDPDKRYSYARVSTDADPGECYIHDVWIVDDEGRIHPGYDSCPVPVRTDDLVLSRGRPMAGETPKPKSIFDSGWLRS